MKIIGMKTIYIFVPTKRPIGPVRLAYILRYVKERDFLGENIKESK
jgi:hypothetical protein